METSVSSRCFFLKSHELSEKTVKKPFLDLENVLKANCTYEEFLKYEMISYKVLDLVWVQLCNKKTNLFNQKTRRKYVQIILVFVLECDYYSINNIGYIFLISEFHIFTNVVTFYNEKSKFVLKYPFVYVLFVLILCISCKFVVMEFLWIRTVAGKSLTYVLVSATGSVDGWATRHRKDPPC